MSSSLVVLQASDLQQLNFLHQGSTRLKVVCFDLSPSLILLGANSGTIYVLDHETLHLKKQIPAGSGCVMQLSISTDEQQVACALSCGTVMVFELQHANAQLLTSSWEHRGQKVTTLVWAFCQPELYIGDASGRVTMLYVSKSKAASLFRSSCLHLMSLESSIIQLDYREGYLLVSTLTHSYVCNTSSETFSQVGTKLRQGEYGGCFCQVNYSRTASPHRKPLEGVEDLQASLTSFSEKFGLSDCYEAMEEDHTYHSSDLRRERSRKTVSQMLTSHVFCARPGTRIWEADHSGKVLVTQQLKSALMVPPAEVLLTDGSFREQDLLEEISLLQETDCLTGRTKDKLTGYEPATSNNLVKATHPPVGVAFTKMMSFYNKYLLAISAYGLYIIDPATSKVLIWVSVSEGIIDVKISGNSLIYKSGSGCIQNLMITTVDIAILVLHTRKLFLECASLCLKNTNAFIKSELLSRLGTKILTDLCINIAPSIVKEKIKGIRFFAGIDKERNHSINFTKISGVTYVKNKSFEVEEIKANLNVALKKKHSVLSNVTVTRWNSEPHLSGSQKEWEQLPSAKGTMSMESSPIWHRGNYRPNDKTSIYLHEAPDCLASADILPSKSLEKYMVDLTSTSHRCSVGSGPDHDSENSTAPSSDHCSRLSDAFSPQKSLESSMEMFDDPLFTPEESPSPDHEAASRAFLDRHHSSTLPYASHNFYNLAYAPIHPGSEAATLLQDLMENVTTNMVDTFTSGTRTLTERLRSVVPLVSPQKGVEGVASESEMTKNHPNNDSEELSHVTPMNNIDSNDDPATIVVQVKSRKKQPQKQLSVLAPSGGTQTDSEETLPQPELPGVVRNLHELVCTTVQQMTSTTNPKEAQELLDHWFKVFCHTVQEIKCDSAHLSPPVSEDQTGEGPVSLSSIESSHSVGSADTSSDSLHWDSSDIGFEPSFLSIDILEKISALFLKSLQAGVTARNLNLSWITPQKADISQHPMTPQEVKRQDVLYAQVIASDCGLLQYSHLLNALESLGHHYYFLTWAALTEKITRNSNTLPFQPLPDIIPDLEFTRAQWVSILHSVASSGSTKNLITTAAKIESPIVIQDVIFLFQYMIAHPEEMNCSLSKTQTPRLLLQYLTEFSQHRSLTKAYLDSWCLYSELQSDILKALLSVTSPSHFSCKCGLPLPHRRHTTLEVLEEIMLLHDIVDPRGFAEMCQSLGYWKGYCAITLAYCLQPHTQLFPYILQTCDANLLNNFLEVLHCDDFGMAFSTLARISSKDISTMLCFRCQSRIPFPEKESIFEDSRKVLNHSVIMNGDFHLTENSFKESCPIKASRKKSIDDQIPIQETAAVESMSRLWEVVVAKILRRSGAANTLKLLSNVQDTISPGMISKRVFNWCILASLAEQRGPAACWAILDCLCGDRTKLFSHKVFQAIHRRASQKSHGDQANDMSSEQLCWSKQFPDTAQNGISQPPTSATPKDSSHLVPLGHHWGVWAEVLEGVCYCCHLRLSTQALVSEGGITVFSCSHAFHTICLSQRGHQCVRCAQPQPSIAAH